MVIRSEKRGYPMTHSASRWQKPVAILAGLFGVATLVAGGSALFGGNAVRAAAGNAVPFVLWFNFLAGFAYLAGAVALWKNHSLAQPIAWGIGLATMAVFAGFAIAVWRGQPHEMRTFGAMTLRAGFWLITAFALGRRPRLPPGA